jgi:hypothetical protein
MKETWESLQTILGEFNNAEDGLIKRLAMGKYQQILALRAKHHD